MVNQLRRLGSDRHHSVRVWDLDALQRPYEVVRWFEYTDVALTVAVVNMNVTSWVLHQNAHGLGHDPTLSRTDAVVGVRRLTVTKRVVLFMLDLAALQLRCELVVLTLGLSVVRSIWIRVSTRNGG